MNLTLQLSFEEYDEAEDAVRQHLSSEDLDLYVATGYVSAVLHMMPIHSIHSTVQLLASTCDVAAATS
jgi:hypothetical protein